MSQICTPLPSCISWLPSFERIIDHHCCLIRGGIGEGLTEILMKLDPSSSVDPENRPSAALLLSGHPTTLDGLPGLG